MQRKFKHNIPATSSAAGHLAEPGVLDPPCPAQHLLDSTPAIIFSVDCSYAYTAYNRAHAQTMQEAYGAQIELGRSVLDFITVEAQRADTQRNLDRALAGEPVFSVTYFGQAAPSRQRFEARYTPTRAENGGVTGVVVMAQNVTQFETTKENLKTSDDLFRSLFGTLSSPILIFDPHTAEILDANLVACAFYGYAYDELTRLKIPDLSGLPAQEVKEYFARVLAGGVAAINVQHRLASGQMRDVEIFPVEVQFKGRQAIMAVILDVTERKQAEQMVKENELQLLSIIDAVPNLVWTASPDGAIDFCNQSWLAYTGMSLGQIQNGGWKLALHTEDAEESERKWVEALSSQLHYEVERRLRRFDGEFRWFLAYAQPVLNADGSVRKWYGAETDITERKQMELSIIERVKELTCLHEVGLLVVNPAISEGDLCQQVVEHIPQAMQFPHLAAAALVLSGSRYLARNFPVEPTHRLSAPILSNGQECGQLSVIYPTGVSFILPEEQYLVDNLAGIVGLWHERRKSEAEVRKLTLAVKQNPAAIVITDISGTIEYVNPAFVTLTGYTLEEALGQNPRILKTGHTTTEEYRHLWRTILGGQTWYGEFRNRKKNGELYWESNIISPILDESGTVTHFLALKENIDDRKRDQERIAEVMEFNQTILNSSPIGITIYKASGLCVSANRAAGLIAGTDPEHLRQQNFHTIESWKATGQYAAAMQALNTGQPVSSHLHTTSPFGKEVWLNLTCAPVKIAGEPHLLLISEDDSERQQAEMQLKLSNEKLESLVNDLEESKQGSDRLHRLGDLLQTCLTVAEAYSVIGQFAPQVFPATAGGVLLTSKTQRHVESVVSWGQAEASELVFAVESCWALRRGKQHRVNASLAGLRCQHMPASYAGCYLDIPLVASGETMGLLHIEWPGVEEPGRSLQELAQIMAEHISLSLSNIRLRETLHQQSVRDPLTGTFNRRYMVETMERELPRAARKKSHVGLIILDIDFFKKFNDTYGHGAGDLVLTQLGSLLKSQLRGEDIVCRFGGEEFVLVMPDANLDVTVQRAERIRAAVAAQELNYNFISLGMITISLGVAVFPEHGLTSDQVLQKADAALYRAKNNGRNRVEVAASEAPSI